jgi:hypothetical protein
LLWGLSGCERKRSEPNIDVQASVNAPAISVAPPTAPAVAAASVVASAVAPSCATPDSLGVVRLAQYQAQDPVERAAVTAAGRELVRLLERPAAYFVSAQTVDNRVLVELWHESAFTPAHCASRGADGKSRTLTYDSARRVIVSTKIW